MMRKRWIMLGLLALTGAVQAAGVNALNLLKSPGFEVDGAWRTHCNDGSYAKILTADQVEKPMPEGRRCGYIHKKGGRSTVAALWQDVAVKPGETYLLSGMARGRGKLFLYYYDDKGTFLGSHVGVDVNCAEWVSLSTKVTMIPKAVRAQIRFELFGQGISGEGWVDDVYWGPVPPTPTKVTGLMATAKDGITLSWQPSADKAVTRYEIYRSRYPDQQLGKPLPLLTVQGTSWTDRTVPADWERCFYQVAAVNDLHMVGDISELATVTLKQGLAEPVVWTTSPMEKIRRYQERPVKASSVQQSVSLKLAKNEAEAIQIMVGAQAKPIKRLEVSLSGFDGKLKGSLYQVHYTKVKRPTISPRVNHPGLYADALPPWRGAIQVPEYANQGIWLQLVSAVDCPAGIHKGLVTVTGDGKVLAKIAVQAEVWDFTVPVTPTFQTAFAVWQDCVAKSFGVKVGSPEFKRIYDKYYWFMTERRMPPDDLPVPLTSPEAARYLNDPRVNCFRIPVNPWKTIDVSALKKVADHLRKNGWLSKAYVYCLDEPTPAQYANCRKVAAQVHAASKDIRFLLTEQPEKELKGAVDIWAPILSCIRWPDYEQALKDGEEFWWYTCVYPQEPYPTYLIDDIGVSHRVLSWLQAKHKIQGVLYWSVNIHTTYRNSAYQPGVAVWDEAMLFPNANGDGFLTYPGKQIGIDGPVSCIRLELIRDGNEDVEYVNLLRTLLKKNGCQDVEKEIAAYIQPVARTFQDWERNPQTLEEQRVKLAQRILLEMKR